MQRRNHHNARSAGRVTIRTVATIIAVGVFCTVSPSSADNVEIYLVDRLDNTQNGYCIDIARAQGDKADPADGLQGHTCYSPKGELMVDQIFDTDRFPDNILFMPEFDVCMEFTSAESGAALALNTCNGSDAQSFSFSAEGFIQPTIAPELCVTVAQDTRTGRSSENQIKVLSLETCTDDSATYQTWAVREG